MLTLSLFFLGFCNTKTKGVLSIIQFLEANHIIII